MQHRTFRAGLLSIFALVGVLGSPAFAAPPSPPSGVSATNDTYCDRVRVTWSVSAGATSYQIWRHTTSNPAFSTFIANDSGSPFDDYTAVPGQNYRYWVRAVNADGVSNFGNSDSGSRRDQLPQAPGNLAASDATYCAYVRLTWNAVTNATSYQIYRNTANNRNAAVQIATDTASPFNDTSAAPGTTYYYWIKAVTTCGVSDWSNGDNGRRSTQGPAIPTNVKAADAASCEFIRVSWNAVSQATSYQIWRSTGSSSANATLIDTDNASPFNDTSATPGVNYRYWIKAVNSCGISGFSAADVGSLSTTNPGTPGSVAASDDTYCDRVRITWGTVTGANSYRIYRGTSNSPGAATLIGTAGSSPYNDTTAVPGTNYWYFVRAANACGTGPYSTGNAGRRSNTGPNPPSGVAGSDGTYCDKVRVSWNSVSGSTGYAIYRSTSNQVGSAVFLANDTGSPYDDTTANTNTIYYYWVRATGPCGTSGFSTGNNGSRSSNAPTPPGGVTATDGTYCDKVRVSWNGVSGATEYRILRSVSSSSTNAVQIATSTTSPYDDTSANAGTTYYYWIRAVTPCGVSNFSNPNAGYRNTNTPQPPSSVAASDGTYCNRVQVSWSNVSGASTYQIWRNTSNSSSSATQIGTDSLSPFDDTTAITGVTYYYWVRTVAGCGASNFSASNAGSRGTGGVTPPTTVAATDGTSCTSVRVTWSGGSGATGYAVYRSPTNNALVADQIATSASPFDDFTAVPGTTYWYFIRPISSCGQGAFSNSNSGRRAICDALVGAPPVGRPDNPIGGDQPGTGSPPVVGDRPGDIPGDAPIEPLPLPDQPIVLDPEHDPALKRADITRDGIVDLGDLEAIFAQWGQCAADGQPCTADLDADSAVGPGDLAWFLRAWSLLRLGSPPDADVEESPSH